MLRGAHLSTAVGSALWPVVLLIAAGWLAARLRWLRPQGVSDLSNLVFMLLTPALLFRTMSGVRVQDLALGPVAIYFVAAVGWLLALWGWFGRDAAAAVRALAATFGNTVMIGIPLVTLAWGQAGLVTLLALISLHALILLTLSTVLLEAASVQGRAGRGRWGQLALTLRNGILHPVPLPILLGLSWAQTGWTIAPELDGPLRLLAQAFGPMALVLVGASLAGVSIGAHWRAALRLALLKIIGLPLVFASLAWLAGMHGPARDVLLVAAALPAGANVFLFAQKYGVAQDEVTAAMGASNVLALLSLTVLLATL